MTVDDYILAYVSFHVDLAYPINCLHHLCEISDNVDDFPEYFNPHQPFPVSQWRNDCQDMVIILKFNTTFLVIGLPNKYDSILNIKQIQKLGAACSFATKFEKPY